MMKWISITFIILFAMSCSTSYYLSYNGDVYLSGKEVYKDVQVLDKQIPNEIFFYDQKRTGHLLMGDVSVKSTSDTVYVKK